MASPTYAVLGNTQSLALIHESGAVAWAAFPWLDDQPVFEQEGLPFTNALTHGGVFELEPDEPYTIERAYMGETSVLHTTYTTAGGKALVMDYLPIRPGRSVHEARVVKQRLIRVVEGMAGEMAFHWRFSARPEGLLRPDLSLDPNGLVCSGQESSLLLQTEAEAHLQELQATGHFAVAAREKRHFVLTHVPNPDPDVPEVSATEPEWEMDGTFDFWLAWARHCPFQGAQREVVLKLAGMLKAWWVPPHHHGGRLDAEFYANPACILAPVALAAWGWEGELADAMKVWAPKPESTFDRAASAWLLEALATAQATGLVEATLVTPHWARLQPMVDAIAAEAGSTEPDVRLLMWRGLRAGLSLADELLLPGDQARWRAALAEAERGLDLTGSRAELAQALGLEAASPPETDEPPTDGLAASWRIRRELATGGYLQARRRMDHLLLAYGPLGVLAEADRVWPDPGELAFVLWTAAEIYLQGAPEAGRVDMPGDLGE